jgi:hypothetical protein
VIDLKDRRLVVAQSGTRSRCQGVCQIETRHDGFFCVSSKMPFIERIRSISKTKPISGYIYIYIYIVKSSQCCCCCKRHTHMDVNLRIIPTNQLHNHRLIFRGLSRTGIFKDRPMRSDCVAPEILVVVRPCLLHPASSMLLLSCVLHQIFFGSLPVPHLVPESFHNRPVSASRSTSYRKSK